MVFKVIKVIVATLILLIKRSTIFSFFLSIVSDLISVLVALNWSGFVLVIVLFSKERKFNSRSNGTFVGLKQMLELPDKVQRHLLRPASSLSVHTFVIVINSFEIKKFIPNLFMEQIEWENEMIEEFRMGE